MFEMKILLVCANPKGSDQLRSGEEDRVLRESIRLSRHRESLNIDTLNAATVDDLRRALLDAQAMKNAYDIVHFSGHGTNRGLLFEDSNGQEFVPESGALAKILAARGVKVALFNACYSLSAGQLTAGQLEHTIATTGPISDPAAIEFTRGFYDAIGAGLGVPEAFKEGVSAAAVKNYRVATVLLAKGQSYVSENRTAQENHAEAQKLLVGALIDVSGSMETNMRNDNGHAMTRLEGASEAIARFGRSMKEEIARASLSEEANSVGVFCYAFGTRTGDVVDLFSLFKASQSLDIESEILSRRQKYEAEVRRTAGQYSGLASLARSHGFGTLVDSFARSLEEDAKRTVRNRITAEISHLLFDRTREAGDTTLTVAELSDLWKNDGSARFGDMEALIYGNTPMKRAVEAARQRFEREPFHENETRILFVVSDGEPTDGDPIDQFDGIKAAGVAVVCCFVTDEDISEPRRLYADEQPGWSRGARLMFGAASSIEPGSKLVRQLKDIGWEIPNNGRLFVQANHTDIVAEFIKACGADVSARNQVSLPKGR